MVALARLIRQRREELGFSVDGMARLSRLSAGRIDELEKGATLSTSELALLADALAVDPADLTRGIEGDAKRSTARFRAPGGSAPIKPADIRLLARAQEAGRICGELRKLLGDDSSPISKFRQVRYVEGDRATWKQGYDLGASARMALSPEPRPLESVQELLESLCIHVATVLFDTDGIEAASLFEPGACPVILLNSQQTRVQYPLSRRAILAHELCHVLHDGGENDLVTQVSRLNDEDPIEQRANGFAPSFIAPAPWVSVRSLDPMKIAQEIGLKWGLSFEGAVWHAKNLNQIEANKAEALIALKKKPKIVTAFERPLERTPPDQFGIDVVPSSLTSGHLAERIIIACAEGLISRGRAAELLSLA